MWIFLALFVFSLFAEFIANDKPIVAYYKGELLFPVLVDYPESKFGGFLAVTDYKDTVILEEIEKQRLGHLAADRLLLPFDQQGLSAHQERERPVPGLPRAAALVDRAPSCARRPPTRSRATRPSATATGSAPTTRAATCWRA